MATDLCLRARSSVVSRAVPAHVASQAMVRSAIDAAKRGAHEERAAGLEAVPTYLRRAQLPRILHRLLVRRRTDEDEEVLLVHLSIEEPAHDDRGSVAALGGGESETSGLGPEAQLGSQKLICSAARVPDVSSVEQAMTLVRKVRSSRPKRPWRTGRASSGRVMPARTMFAQIHTRSPQVAKI